MIAARDQREVAMRHQDRFPNDPSTYESANCEAAGKSDKEKQWFRSIGRLAGVVYNRQRKSITRYLGLGSGVSKKSRRGRGSINCCGTYGALEVLGETVVSSAQILRSQKINGGTRKPGRVETQSTETGSRTEEEKEEKRFNWGRTGCCRVRLSSINCWSEIESSPLLAWENSHRAETGSTMAYNLAYSALPSQ